MEWLEEKLLAVTLAAMSAWYWYDKRMRDKRFTELEVRMGHIEQTSGKQQTQLELLNAHLESFSKLTDVRLEHIQSGMDKVLQALEKSIEKK